MKELIAAESWKKVSKISDSSISETWIVQDKKGKDFVCKFFKSQMIAEARREYLFLKTINDPHVVKAVAYGNGEAPWLQLEYIEGEHPKKSLFNSSESISEWVASLAIIIAHIHACGIVLNDVKPSNIITRKSCPYVIDFGLASVNLYQDDLFRGTFAYAAPEKIKHHTNLQAGDIFSLGMVLYYLMNGNTVADLLGFDTYQSLIVDSDKWNTWIQENVQDSFLCQMLHPSPKDRPSAIAVATHYSAQCKAVLPELTSWELQSFIFQSQLQAVDRLWKKKQLHCQFADEPFRIEHLLALHAESIGKKLLILDELLFTSQPELFFQSFPIGYRDKSVFKDTFLDWLKGQTSILLLKRNKSKGLSGLFDELMAMEETLILWDDSVSEVKQVPMAEIAELINRMKFTAKAKIDLKKRLRTARPFHIRNILLEAQQRSRDKLDDNELLDLLKWIETPFPVTLVEKIWDSWFLLIQDGILEHQIRIEGDQLIAEIDKSSTIDIDLDLLDKVDSVAMQYGHHYIAGMIRHKRKQEDKALAAWEKYVEELSQKQYYFSAYEFLKQLRTIVPYSKYPFELRKKEAFIARICGRFDEAMQYYSQLRKETGGVKEAILAVDQAIVLQSLHRHEEAISIYREAITLFKTEQEWKGMLRAMNNLGVIYFGLQRYHDAELAFNEVLQEARNLKNVQFETISFLNLSDIYLKSGDWNKASFYAEKAIVLSAANQKWNLLVNGIILSGRALFAMGDHAKAIQRLEDLLLDLRSRENQPLNAEINAWLLHFCDMYQADKAWTLFKEIVREGLPEEEIILRELFFVAYHRHQYWQAARFSNAFEHLPIMQAFLDGDLEAILNRLHELKQQQEIDSYLYYGLHLLRTDLLPVSHQLYEDIKEASELYTFEPIRRLKQSSKSSRSTLEDNVFRKYNILLSSMNLEEVIDSSLYLLLYYSKMERAIYLDCQSLPYKAITGYDQYFQKLLDEDMLLSRSLVQRASKSHGVQFFDHVEELEPVEIHSSILGLGLKHVLCASIYLNGQLMGMFYCDSRSELLCTEAEKQQLRLIGMQIQSSLERNRFFTLLQERSEITTLESSQQLSHSMIGNSKAMLDVFNRISMVAKYNVNVLITGPTGSGKELVAKAIHAEFTEQNPWGGKTPFIAVNCAAIPEQLLESELFGYKKGAFTGAVSDKKGKLELAEGGSLFLDEIGEMPLLLQAKVLRVIQDRVVTPLGSNTDIPVNVRIIAATNQNLEEQIAQNNFRADLYYRLNVVTINLPSLSERKDDIPLLVHAFIQKFNQKFSKAVSGIHPNALQFLQQHEWRGNVRELENAIERAVLLCQKDYINLDDFGIAQDSDTPSVFTHVPLVWSDYQDYRQRFIDELDSRYIKSLLDKTNGNISAAGKIGKLERIQVYRLLKKKQ